MQSYLRESSLPMTGILVLVGYLLLRAVLVESIERNYLIELEAKQAKEAQAASDRWAPQPDAESPPPHLVGWRANRQPHSQRLVKRD